MTRLTSLVAVDKTPSRPEGEPLKLAELPLNLPAGWDFEKVFGERRAAAGKAPMERRARCTRPGGSTQCVEASVAGANRDASRRHAAEDRDRRGDAR